MLNIIKYMQRSAKVSSIPKRHFYQELSIKDLPPSNVKIRDIRYLPGASNRNLPEYISLKEHENLKIIYVDRKAENYKEKLGKFVAENIENFPAILIKGVGLESASELRDITKHFPFKPIGYETGVTIRHEVEKTIFTASDESGQHNIELHNEMSYQPNSPGKILFSCISQAEIGGETPISFNKDISKSLDPYVTDSLTKRKIRYLRNLGDGDNKDYLSWQDTFGTNSRNEAEAIMKQSNMKWEWNEIGGLSTYNIGETQKFLSKTNEYIWFNQATACHWTYYEDHPTLNEKCYKHPKQYPSTTCYGDGAEIETEVLDHIREAHWKNAIPLKLEKGDILLLDNYLCCHSRIAFEGDRRMLTQLFC